MIRDGPQTSEAVGCELVMSARRGQDSGLSHTSGPSRGSGTDIDECEDDEDPVCGDWRCENSPGSYRCVLGCQPGFYMAPTGDCIGEGGRRRRRMGEGRGEPRTSGFPCIELETSSPKDTVWALV